MVVHGENRRRAEQRYRDRQSPRARVAAAKDRLVKDERLKPRRSRSWRKKTTNDDEHTPSTNEDEANAETKTQKPTKWKGKRKLNARRTLALDALFETFNTFSRLVKHNITSKQ